jgi:DNA-directed RNA polymerase specialized sigma24 family protein
VATAFKDKVLDLSIDEHWEAEDVTQEILLKLWTKKV